ncbi:MAG TPA: AAA family ATPase [Bryobacteraceae bacterium]|nr:AAA family ATPase [Bryobacteraceae bacterium]
MASLRVLLDPTKLGREAETLEDKLKKSIVGQEEAVGQIVDRYQTFVAGMSNPGRPVANFLFLGPTGSGKTRTVEALAEALVGDSRAVIKIDCAEFQHGHEIAKLIGSPPGYLGHRETHPLLSQEMLNQHQTDTCKLSFVLFDEIEKASDSLWNLLLGILDRATLTLGDNRRVDFSQAMIFMTSNLGADEMQTMLRPALGFAVPAAATPEAEEKLADKMGRAGVEAARSRFTPEFMNRIDKVVVFHPLGDNELRRILNLELGYVLDRLRNAAGTQDIGFKLDGAARALLLKEGTDARYGARHLKRAIERLLVQPMANLIATGQVARGDQVFVHADARTGRLAFLKEFKGAAPQIEAESGTTAAA